MKEDASHFFSAFPYSSSKIVLGTQARNGIIKADRVFTIGITDIGIRIYRQRQLFNFPTRKQKCHRKESWYAPALGLPVGSLYWSNQTYLVGIIENKVRPSEHGCILRQSSWRIFFFLNKGKQQHTVHRFLTKEGGQGLFWFGFF